MEVTITNIPYPRQRRSDMTTQHTSDRPDNKSREGQTKRTTRAGIELVEHELIRVTGGSKLNWKF